MIAPQVTRWADITVGVARPDQYAAVRALIVDGLMQRWGAYESSFNPDLEAFGSVYGSALVLVAMIDAQVVGCGILVREGPDVARIVRMSVTSAHQRNGIGSKVLGVLLEQAASRGYKEVVLETSAAWSSAVAFYASRGFERMDEKDGDQHFRLLL